MDKKRILAGGGVVAILDALIHLQYQHWRSFDWLTFWHETHRINKGQVFYAVVLIYSAYLMRAIRWRIFLQRVRPNGRVLDIVSPTLVGFTGLALLGRAGEFIRPYLIARRTNLPFSSQLAAWAVERIFDVGAFTVLMLAAIFLPSALSSIPHPEYYKKFQEGGIILACLVLAMSVVAVVISRVGESFPQWVSGTLGPLFSVIGAKLGTTIRRLSGALQAMHYPCLVSYAALVGLRLLLAYGELTAAHDAHSLGVMISHVVWTDTGVFVAAFGSLITLDVTSMGGWMEEWIVGLPRGVADRLREFGEGLKTIHGKTSFLCLVGVSVGMWYVIALAYKAVTHSYGVDALDIPVSQVLILMGASMVGSMLQLPAVGGGSQMATIATLLAVFDVPAELAASCGILLWLVTFAAVVPVGLLLAHQERLSLRKLSVESHQAESHPDEKGRNS